jgi:hypothetical protein
MQFSFSRFVIYLGIAFSIILPAIAAPATDSPDAVVHALYSSCEDHFGFDLAIVKTYQPWLTPALYARILKKANEPVTKGDAPDIEGDLFFNSQETPTKFTVGQPFIDPTKAKVPVTVIVGLEKHRYIVLLEQIDGAWKVSDVHYGKDGKLTDLL